MLKNDAGALPILGGKLAVIGPLADAAADMRGCWAAAGLPKDCTSVLDGLRAALPGQEIAYAEGAAIASDDESGIAQAAAQGAVGGITSMAEGGNFGSGFLAAGFGSLAGPLGVSGGQFSNGNLIASAALGGVGSVLGGGKFANGAITGAFAYAASASYANDNDPANANAPEAALSSASGTGGAQVSNQVGVPDRLIIQNPQGNNQGSYSIFNYQLVDANGIPLTGPGYSLEENVYPDYGPSSNTNYHFQPSSNGTWPDIKGWGPGSQLAFIISQRCLSIRVFSQMAIIPTRQQLLNRERQDWR